MAPPRRRAPWLVAAVVAAGIAVAATLSWRGPVRPRPLPAPGLSGPVDAAGLLREAHVALPAVLTHVYEAFAETDEAAIYDGLAGVTAGGALEALYLERAGALASGGLPDQVVHEIRLLSGD